MTNTIKIHNATTGEIIEREMTAEELAEFETSRAAAIEHQKTLAEIAKKREEAKAKLEALGLTPDDLKALGL